MKLWIIQDGEPIPGIDENTREWRAAMLAKALVARGHEVVWWASIFDHAHKRHRFATSQTIEQGSCFQVRLLYGPGYRHNKSPRRIWHNRVLAHNFAKEAALSSKRPDLVFSSLPTLELAEQAVLYGKKTAVPVIVDVRDLWPDIYLTLVPNTLQPVMKLLLASEFRRCCRVFQNTTGIVSISNVYLDWALNKARRKRRESDDIFPMGFKQLTDGATERLIEKRIRDLTNQLDLSDTGMVLTFVGSFTPSFDMETVINAARIIERQGNLKVRLLIVGAGDMGPKWQKQANGIKNLTFTGWLDQISISALLRLSSVGLAPYNNELISLPNKPFEYMAAGLPLLSSLGGELEGLIQQKQIGLHYCASNAELLAEKICWLAEHPEERISMGQRGQRLFEEQFRADIIYPKLVTHLERIVTNGLAH